jgi:heme/copper-type cytochrome/quinol oxidase subunit 3
MIRRPRIALDVSELPDVCFGPRDIMWWGTLGFVLIEGFTLFLCAAVYIYLQQNFATWPPEGTPRPSLGIPTVQVAVMLASIPALAWLDRAARRFDLAKVRIGLIVACLFGVVLLGLRAVELLVSLNVKWDANAYGSAQWLVVGSHSTLLLIEIAEMIGIAGMFWLAPVEKKHFSDVADAVFYWYFMVIAWLPLYLLCFLLPRWI